MSHRGDDDGYHPHPGDPWHPGWSTEDEAPAPEEPGERAPVPEAPAAEEPGERAPAPEATPRREGRRRFFGRERRRRSEEVPPPEEGPDLGGDTEAWPEEEAEDAAAPADGWPAALPPPSGGEPPGEAPGGVAGVDEASLGPVERGEQLEVEQPDGEWAPWVSPAAEEATESALAEPFAAALPAEPAVERLPGEPIGELPRPPQWAPPITALPVEEAPPAGPPPAPVLAEAGPDLAEEAEVEEWLAFTEGSPVPPAPQGPTPWAETLELAGWPAEQEEEAVEAGTEAAEGAVAGAEGPPVAAPADTALHRPPPWAPPAAAEHRPPPWIPPEVPQQAALAGLATTGPGEAEVAVGTAPGALWPAEEEVAGRAPVSFEEDEEAAWEAWAGPAEHEASREVARGPAAPWHPRPEAEPAAPVPYEEPEEGGWEAFPEPGMPLRRGTQAPRGPARYEPAGAPGSMGEAWEGEAWEEEAWEGEGEEAAPAPAGRPPWAFDEPAARGRVDESTAEIPQPYVFDFERPARRQGPISEETLTGAATTEHRGLAEEIAAADTAETELQALSAPMAGLEPGMVGFGDVAHLGGDEEFVAPDRSDLGIRVVTGMVLAAMLLGAMWVGGEFLAGFIGVLVVLGLGEFYGALRRSGYRPLALFGFLGGAGLLVGTWFHGLGAVPIAVVGTTVLTFFYYAFASRRHDALTNGGLTVLGMLWVTGTAAFAFPIAASEDFRVLVLAVAAAVVATDMGAFFAGRAWGSRPLAPVLSPHKTVEGLAGGVVLGIAAATAAGYFLDPLDIRSGAALGLVVAVMAPLGDLAESMLKRSLGIKDMGSLLPGHGGIVDRIDAFLFVLPACWVLFETLGLLR